MNSLPQNAASSSAAAHPLAGKVMTGAEMIVQVLADEGTTAIFGYSGGAILPTYDAVFLYNQAQAEAGGRQMPLIVPANEQGAGFMAAGYARASGRVGVCVVTSGPGATNTVTPVRDCMADSIPMVVICGQVPTSAIGSDAFQEAPVAAIMGAVAKHVFLVTDATQLEATVRTAFEIARTGRPGPVVIDVPKDVQNWSGAFAGAGKLAIPGYRKRLFAANNGHVEDDEAKEFFAALAAAKRPLLYAGGGVVNAGAARELREFAAAFDVPVVTTLMGIGAVDTTDRLSLRMLGMHGAAFANYAVEDCDFLIAVGARFDDRVAGVPAKFAPNAKRIAHIDIDRAEINKVKRVHWSHVGQLDDALRTLTAYGRRTGFRPDYSAWHRHLDELRTRHAMNYDRASELIQPYYVIEEINRHAKGEAIIATGVGQHQMWAGQWYKYKFPRQFISSAGLGSMGFGFPAALGVKVAHPDKQVVDIDGDGSFLMNIQELATANVEKIAAKAIILNNQHLGMVVQWEDNFYGGNRGHTYLGNPENRHSIYPDYVKVCTSFNVPCERVVYRKDLRAALQRMLDSKTAYVLDVITPYTEHVLPFIPAGRTVADMIWKA